MCSNFNVNLSSEKKKLLIARRKRKLPAAFWIVNYFASQGEVDSFIHNHYVGSIMFTDCLFTISSCLFTLSICLFVYDLFILDSIIFEAQRNTAVLQYIM